MSWSSTFILLVTFGLGIVVGLVGTGGALLLPVLIFLFGLEQHHAQGTALLISAIPITFLPFLPYYQSGSFDLRVALLSAVGLALGGYLGATFAQDFPAKYLRYALGVVLAVGAVRMFISPAPP